MSAIGLLFTSMSNRGFFDDMKNCYFIKLFTRNSIPKLVSLTQFKPKTGGASYSN